MSRRMALFPLLFAFMLAIPGASAQFAINLEGPAAPTEVAVGESGEVAFSVSMESSGNVVCATESTVSITLEATKTDTSLGLGATISPPNAQFTIEQNAYVDGATTKWSSASESGILTVTIGDAIPAGHPAHVYGIKATYDGTQPPNCHGDFDGSEISTSTDVTVNIIHPPPMEDPDTNGGTGPSTNGNDTNDGDTEEGSAPALFLPLVGAVALAAFMRRRA